MANEQEDCLVAIDELEGGLSAEQPSAGRHGVRARSVRGRRARAGRRSTVRRHHRCGRRGDNEKTNRKRPLVACAVQMGNRPSTEGPNAPACSLLRSDAGRRAPPGRKRFLRTYRAAGAARASPGGYDEHAQDGEGCGHRRVLHRTRRDCRYGELSDAVAVERARMRCATHPLRMFASRRHHAQGFGSRV